MIDWEKLRESIDVEGLGAGLPFAMLLLAGSFITSAWGGLTTFNALGGYAKLGVIVLVVASAVSFIAAGYLFNKYDFESNVLTSKDDRDSPFDDEESDDAEAEEVIANG